MKVDGKHGGRSLIGTFVWCLILFRYEIELQSVDGFDVHNNVDYGRKSRRLSLEPSRSTRNLPNMPTIRIQHSSSSSSRNRRRMRRASPLSSSKLTTDSVSNESGVGSSAATATATASLNPIESWCTTHVNVWYDKSLTLKCPFIRRRMTDMLDGLDMVMRFLIIRHKSLPLIGPPPGCRSAIATGRSTATNNKHKHLELAELVETIRFDWKPHKGHK
eukprot:jgi/Psemu1/24280/gm1.24280_g